MIRLVRKEGLGIELKGAVGKPALVELKVGQASKRTPAAAPSMLLRWELLSRASETGRRVSKRSLNRALTEICTGKWRPEVAS